MAITQQPQEDSPPQHAGRNSEPWIFRVTLLVYVSIGVAAATVLVQTAQSGFVLPARVATAALVASAAGSAHALTGYQRAQKTKEHALALIRLLRAMSTEEHEFESVLEVRSRATPLVRDLVDLGYSSLATDLELALHEEFRRTQGFPRRRPT